jgi:dsRNA-specific ribonuclease
MSRYLRADPAEPCSVREARRGIFDSIRVFPFALGRTWLPPGTRGGATELTKKQMKAAADAMEALIGVLFDCAGPAAAQQWLVELRLLPLLAEVRRAASIACPDARCYDFQVAHLTLEAYVTSARELCNQY